MSNKKDTILVRDIPWPNRCKNLEQDLSIKKCLFSTDPYDQSDELITPAAAVSKSSRVKRSATGQYLNDLNYLNKIKVASPNVHFVFGNNKTISFHSLVLLARSDWFRRSWRNRDSNNNEYNFNIKSDFHLDIDISLETELPEYVHGKFEFSINKTRILEDDVWKALYNSFKQFKEFLYHGFCEIDEKNSLNLISLSTAFGVNSLRSYLCDYLIHTINERFIDGILYRLELAHVYDLKDLKMECISTVNHHSVKIVNSANWKQFAVDYPELVMDIFRKNN